MANAKTAGKPRGLNMRITLRKPKTSPEDAQRQSVENRLALADQPYVASLPGVNVLPPGTLRRQRNRAMVRRFIGAGIAIAVVAVVCYGGSVVLNVIHQQQLDQIRETNAALSSQVAKLQPYSSYQTSLDNARKTVSTSLTSDLDVGRLLRDLNSVAARYGVTYTQISVTTNGGTTSGTAASGTTGTSGSGQCLNPDPFNPPTSIGCITLSGTTASQANATAYFNQFNNQTGFLNGFISGLTTGAATTGGSANNSSFNGTVAFDSAFYSNKYRSYATPLSSLTQGNTSTSGASTASISQLRTVLAARYPTALSGVSDSTLTGMVTSVCTAANSGSATVASLQTVVNTSLNKTVSAGDSTGIIGSTISLACPEAQSKVSGVTGSTTGSTTNG